MAVLYCARCDARTEHTLLGPQGRVKAVCRVCGRAKRVVLVRLRLEQAKNVSKDISIIFPKADAPVRALIRAQVHDRFSRRSEPSRSKEGLS